MIQAAGIWADGWFYISAAGFLISIILFFFLLGQYRAAAEAEDAVPSDSPESDASAAEDVYAKKDEVHVETLVPVSNDDHAPEEISAPVRSIPSIAGEPAKESVFAPIVNGVAGHWETEIPAIKSELAEMHSDFKQFLERYEAERGGASEREAALIERLGELAKALQRLKPASLQDQPAAVEPVSVRKTKKAEPEPQKVEAPAVVIPAPAAALAAALPSPVSAQKPDISVDATMRMELEAVIEAQRGVSSVKESEAQPEAAAAAVDTAEASVPEPKPRRGPVWPV